MDYSLPGSSVHEILQARILEWVVIPFSRWSSQPRDLTHVSCIGRWILYHWVTLPMQRADSFEKTQMLGKIEGRRRRGRQRIRCWMASPTWWTWVWENSELGSWWWTGRPGVLWFMGWKESDMTERLNWTPSHFIPPIINSSNYYSVFSEEKFIIQFFQRSLPLTGPDA